MPICSICKKDIDFVSCTEYHIVKDWAVREIIVFCSEECHQAYVLAQMFPLDLEKIRSDLARILPQKNLEKIEDSQMEIVKSFLDRHFNKIQKDVFKSTTETENLKKILNDLNLSYEKELDSYHQSSIGDAIKKINLILLDLYSKYKSN